MLDLFSKYIAYPAEGWKTVTLNGQQLHPAFCDKNGMFLYGLFELKGASAEEIEAELVVKDPESQLRIAVIDTSFSGWDPSKTAAFRLDCDFYIFTAVTPERLARLKNYLEPQVPFPILCFTTSM
jgi:hypothetical protein